MQCFTTRVSFMTTVLETVTGLSHKINDYKVCILMRFLATIITIIATEYVRVCGYILSHNVLYFICHFCSHQEQDKDRYA